MARARVTAREYSGNGEGRDIWRHLRIHHPGNDLKGRGKRPGNGISGPAGFGVSFLAKGSRGDSII